MARTKEHPKQAKPKQSRAGPSQRTPRRAFDLPKASQQAYHGHIDRLKSKLIRKAKIKQQYHKALKQEGELPQAALPEPEASTSEPPRPARRPKQPRPEAPPKEVKPKTKRKTQEEIASLREARAQDKKAFTSRTAKGQPNLNARMQSLLHKIEKQS